MKIDINAADLTLSCENSDIDEQMSLCEQQERALASISCSDFGLKGEAYSAFENCIRMRTLVINSHYYAYQAIQTANNENIRMLAELSETANTPSIDTDLCNTMITTADEEIASLEKTRNTLISDAVINSYKHPLAEANLSTTIENINSAYQQQIDGWISEREGWETKRDAAIKYNAESSQIYAEAQDYIISILRQTTSAVRDCNSTGEYHSGKCDPFIEWLSEYRIKKAIELAEPPLTDEEIAALKTALADGYISPEEIYRVIYYTGGSEFNEPLYSALGKLPDFLVDESTVSAIASAYNTMWTRMDISAIESFFELSYIPIDGKPIAVAVYNKINSGKAGVLTQEIDGFSLFKQTSLLDRVSDATLIQMSTVSIDDTLYQRLLAGTNLIGCLSQDDHLIWSDCVKMKLYVTEFYSQNAILCKLDINPSGPLIEDIEGFMVFGQEDQVSTTVSFVTATGDLNAIANIMSKNTTTDLTDSDFHIFGADGFIVKESLSIILEEAISALKNEYPWLNFFVIPARVGIDLVDQERQAEIAGVLQDPFYNDVSSSARSSLLNEFGFALNLRMDESSGPSSYLTHGLEVYIPNDTKNMLGNLIGAYDKSMWSSYSIDNFIEEMKNNPYESIVPNAEKHTGAYDFLAWSDKPAELVWKSDGASDEGVPHSAGDPIGQDIKNYDFIIGRKGPVYSQFKYPWE